MVASKTSGHQYRLKTLWPFLLRHHRMVLLVPGKSRSIGVGHFTWLALVVFYHTSWVPTPPRTTGIIAIYRDPGMIIIITGGHYSPKQPRPSQKDVLLKMRFSCYQKPGDWKAGKNWTCTTGVLGFVWDLLRFV